MKIEDIIDKLVSDIRQFVDQIKKKAIDDPTKFVIVTCDLETPNAVFSTLLHAKKQFKDLAALKYVDTVVDHVLDTYALTVVTEWSNETRRLVILFPTQGSTLDQLLLAESTTRYLQDGVL